MRKFLAILLALCLTLAFTGCQESSNYDDSDIEDSSESTEEIDYLKIELLPQDANLNQAFIVTVEPEEPPYNLGYWAEDDIVSWMVDIPVADFYSFDILYSRPGQYPEDWGIIEIEMADGNTKKLNFTVKPSGKKGDEEDWSVYIYNSCWGTDLPAGETRISVYPNLDDDSVPYFINLRSITLTTTTVAASALPDPTDNVLSDVDGAWYKHGNQNDDFISIGNGIWTMFRPENGDFTTIGEGTVSMDDGQLAFYDQKEDVSYYSDPVTDGCLLYKGEPYYRAVDSVIGFDEYDGTWYFNGDLHSDYLSIEEGSWQYYVIEGSTISATLGGYLVSDGEEKLLMYDGDTNEQLGRLGFMDDGTLDFEGDKFSK